MATQKTVAFHTLGCKLNYAETSSIKSQFESAGFLSVPYQETADIYILNTCSVTDFADKKCRNFVRKALKINPDAKMVVIGCYAQLKPEEISKIPGVDLVLGASEKFKVLNYIEGLSSISEKALVHQNDIHSLNDFTSAFSFGDRTRSFLKVQDGCDYKCSFCTIPLARGKSRSDTIENILDKAKTIASHGVKEIVLTGVNIGDFGKNESEDHPSSENFLKLIQALDKVEGIDRFRISSIEPNLCNDEIISFVKHSKRFVPHFHMPLQSGSDVILKQMRRRYKSALYASRVQKIKELMPHACIGVDVIVGFPGESDQLFQESYDFINALDISYLHVFTYSERDKTIAAEMKEAVPMNIRKARNAILQKLSSKKKKRFYEQFSGLENKVLFEKTKDETLMSGFTENYLKVSHPINLDYINTIQKVKLEKLNDEMQFEIKLLS